MLERILRIWHVRHPSSGYVQGINDITATVFVVFLSDYLEIDWDIMAKDENVN